MKCSVIHLERILARLAAETNQVLDYSGFERISELVEEKVKTPIGKRYLYDLFRKVEDARKRKVKGITLQIFKIEKLAEFLGYRSFQDFISELENPVHPILKGFIGTYHCYLRRNTEEGVILCSPVEIFEDERRTYFSLKGPEQNYVGDVEFRGNCLFILMKAYNGKQFHHVYRIGQKQRPNVLQGIFSGVSTSFEPIGGRVLLIRTTEIFTTLKNSATGIDILRKSKSKELRRVSEYFSQYNKNNLALLKSMTFGLDDLGHCK